VRIALAQPAAVGCVLDLHQGGELIPRVVLGSIFIVALGLGAASKIALPW
jgi:hypothetical protein